MNDIERNVMNAIKMNRVELLDIVRANSIKHVAEHLESVEDYKKLVLHTTQANMKLAKTGSMAEIKKIRGIPAAPTSYEESYRRAIRMLELCVEEVITVEEDVFNQLVLDEWSWKHHWTMANATYKVGAAF